MCHQLRFGLVCLILSVFFASNPELRAEDSPESRAVLDSMFSLTPQESKATLPADREVAPKEMTTSQLVQAVMSCIARIEVSGTTIARDQKSAPVEHISIGTGFMIDKRGYLVTNAHVVSAPPGTVWQNLPTISLSFPKSGREVFRLEYRADVVGCDEWSDLAVLRMEPNRLFGPAVFPVLGFARSSAKLGEAVVAIGYAKDQEGDPSVTKGIVSGVGRSFREGRFSGLIQMDAAINPGNSGGPLLNTAGEVVGVNTYRLPPTVQANVQGDGLELDADVPLGMFYARSSETAGPFVDMLIREGCVPRGSLGVTVATLSSTRAKRFGYPSGGALVTDVVRGSAAEAAGIRSGDLIFGIRSTLAERTLSREIQNVGDYLNQLALIGQIKPVEVHLYRPGQRTLQAIQAGEPLRGNSALTASWETRTNTFFVITH